MTLAQRLLLAIAMLTILTTGALGFGVRQAWRQREASLYAADLRKAGGQITRELRLRTSTLPAWLGQHCEHDPAIDQALVGVRRGSASVPVTWRVRELRRSQGVATLRLLADDGQVLGASWASCDGQPRCGADALVGTRQKSAAKQLLAAKGLERRERPDGIEVLVSDGDVTRHGDRATLKAHCIRRWRGRAVILVAEERLDERLKTVGSLYGLDLSLTPSAGSTPLVGALGDRSVTVHARRSAARSREEAQALENLDVTVAALGLGTLAGALLLAWALARGLARPIVDLSAQARRVAEGHLDPVKARGGRELAQLADAFNGTLRDLVELRKRLATSERIAARREIARRVAHEIKNPLAPIRAAVETLRRLRAREDPAFDEYFDEASRTVLDEVNRINGIVSEFTRFARLPAPEPKPVDLAAVVRKVAGLHVTGGANVQPEIGEVPEVIADEDQLVQVLTNLIKNGLEATDHEGRIQVTLRALDPERVELAVSDDGPGVAPTMVERLFEPYATSKAEGTGLGLAIVQRIVFEHGGTIRHEAPPTGGARFVIELPVAGPSPLTRAPPSVGG